MVDNSTFSGSILMRTVTAAETAQLPETEAPHDPDPDHSIVATVKEMTVEPQGSNSKEQVISPYTSRLLAVLPNAMCPYLPGDRCRTGYYGLRTPICFYTENGEQVTYDPAFIQPSTSHSRDSTRPSPTTPSPPAVKPTTAASKSFVGSLASNDSRGSGSVNSSGGNWPTITQTQPQFWPNRGGQNGRRGNGDDDNGRGRGRPYGRGINTWRGRGGAVRQNQQAPQAQTALIQ